MKCLIRAFAVSHLAHGTSRDPNVVLMMLMSGGVSSVAGKEVLQNLFKIPPKCQMVRFIGSRKPDIPSSQLATLSVLALTLRATSANSN